MSRIADLQRLLDEGFKPEIVVDTGEPETSPFTFLEPVRKVAELRQRVGR
jgi:hypothetical protein